MPAMLDIRTDRARRSCSAVAPRVRSWLCTIHRPDSSFSRMMLASPARTPSEAKYDRFNPFGRDSRITSGKHATVMSARGTVRPSRSTARYVPGSPRCAATALAGVIMRSPPYALAQSPRNVLGSSANPAPAVPAPAEPTEGVQQGVLQQQPVVPPARTLFATRSSRGEAVATRRRKAGTLQTAENGEGGMAPGGRTA